MTDAPEIGKTMALVFVELFFAVLPIIVIGTAAAVSGSYEEFQHFLIGPEWPMTACILYGLTISRSLQGFLRKIQAKETTNIINERIILLLLFPTAGLILSGVFISAAISKPPEWLQWVDYVNTVVAIASFVVLGGSGIKNSE